MRLPILVSSEHTHTRPRVGTVPPHRAHPFARARGGEERGSASLELVVLAPGLLLFIAALIFGGRVAIAEQSVQQAADEAARTASIARSQGTAHSDAVQAARNTLSQQGLDCATVTVTVDTGGFNTPIGTPASVTASVSCPVRVGDLTLPGIPGSHTVRATASSPIDTWRER